MKKLTRKEKEAARTFFNLIRLMAPDQKWDKRREEEYFRNMQKEASKYHNEHRNCA